LSSLLNNILKALNNTIIVGLALKTKKHFH